MARSDSKQDASRCPCGSGLSCEHCCGRFISGQEVAPDACALMRSRYTAYVLGDQDYIQRTWHERSRPEPDPTGLGSCKWLGLDVLAFHPGPDSATVEFVARYKVNGRAQRLHEISRFEKEYGIWYYVDGDFPDSMQGTR